MELLHYARVRALKLAGSQRGARMDLHSSKVRILGFCSPPVNFGVLPSLFFSNLFANTLPVVHSASDVFGLWHLQDTRLGDLWHLASLVFHASTSLTTHDSLLGGGGAHPSPPPLHLHQPTTSSRQADRGFATRCEVARTRFSMISHRRLVLFVQFCLPSSGCETRAMSCMCMVHRPCPYAHRE